MKAFISLNTLTLSSYNVSFELIHLFRQIVRYVTKLKLHLSTQRPGQAFIFNHQLISLSVWCNSGGGKTPAWFIKLSENGCVREKKKKRGPKIYESLPTWTYWGWYHRSAQTVLCRETREAARLYSACHSTPFDSFNQHKVRRAPSVLALGPARSLGELSVNTWLTLKDNRSLKFSFNQWDQSSNQCQEWMNPNRRGAPSGARSL